MLKLKVNVQTSVIWKNYENLCCFFTLGEEMHSPQGCDEWHKKKLDNTHKWCTPGANTGH